MLVFSWLLHHALSFGNIFAPSSPPASQYVSSSDPLRGADEGRVLPKSSLLSAELVAQFDDIRARYAAKGLVLAVVASPKHTGSEWASEVLSFGTADHQGNPVTPDSLFGIASNSKLFTMLSVGLLIEDKTVLPNGALLDWSTKVKDILPEWQLMDPYMSDHVDVLDLMSMRSGMPRHDTSHAAIPPAEAIRSMRYLRPSTEIRRDWQYNNYHYSALSHMIPTLTGMPFIEYVREHIFVPLNLTAATYNSTQAKETGRLTNGFMKVGGNMTACAEEWKRGHKFDLDGGCLGTTENLGWWTETDGTFEAGMGGVIASGADLAKWVTELLDPKILPRSVLQKATHDHGMAVGPVVYPELGEQVYHLAQQTFAFRGHNAAGHTGSVPGQMSRLLYLPDVGLGVFVVVNDDGFGTALAEIMPYMAMDELLGLPAVNWERRVIGRMFERLPKYPDIPSNPAPPLPLDRLVGTYADKGYGKLSLVAYEPPAGVVDGIGADGLDVVIRPLATHAPLNLTGPVLVAAVQKVFASHIVFTHFSSNLWNWTTVAVFTPETGVVGVAEGTGTAVLNGKGIGMFGNFWGKGAAVRDREVDVEGVEEAAEVWYSKVN